MITACDCGNSRSSFSLKTIHAQQHRHLMNIGRNACQRKAFKQDLEHFLLRSTQDDFSIVVALDDNEHMKLV